MLLKSSHKWPTKYPIQKRKDSQKENTELFMLNFGFQDLQMEPEKMLATLYRDQLCMDLVWWIWWMLYLMIITVNILTMFLMAWYFFIKRCKSLICWVFESETCFEVISENKICWNISNFDVYKPLYVYVYRPCIYIYTILFNTLNEICHIPLQQSPSLFLQNFW